MSALRAQLLQAARELQQQQQQQQPPQAPPLPNEVGKRKRSFDDGAGERAVRSAGGSGAGGSGAGGSGAGAPDAGSSSGSAPPGVPGWARHEGLLQGCRDVRACYAPKLGRAIDEGTYGRVYLAEDKETHEEVAIKQIKFEHVQTNDGFPITALREMGLLLGMQHRNIIRVREIVTRPSPQADKWYMVMDYMSHNMRDFLDKLPSGTLFTQGEVKCLLRQLLEGLAYIHGRWVMHRDLKTANLLISPQGRLTICDFGLARAVGSPPRAYTETVVTLWYRAPEVLLGERRYGTPLDVWSAGCIFAELLTRETLFPAQGEAEALALQLQLLGTPTEATWPGCRALPGWGALKAGERSHAPKSLRAALRLGGLGAAFAGGAQLSEQGLDLLQRMLALNPAARITAAEALAHPWWAEYPPATDERLLPAFPAGR